MMKNYSSHTNSIKKEIKMITFHLFNLKNHKI
jgi:hypothetical protein